LIDIQTADHTFTAGDFRTAALAAIDDIHRRGKRALVVGGTGFYLKALLYGLWDAPKADPELRKILESLESAALFEKLPYDATRDVQPVIRLASVAIVLVAHPSLPADSLRDLVALSRNRPNPLQIAVAPLGQPPHVLGLLAQSEANLRLDWLPFKGGVEAVAACRAGDIPLAVEAPSTVVPHIKAGTLKALAVTGTAREPTLPDVPTISEILGRRIPGETWFGLVLPRGTAPEIVARLQRDAAAAIAKPEMRAVYSRFGWRLIEGSSPEEFAATVREEGPRWGEIIRKAGLKLG
jgi:tripartite-type tricarboxylate transporter receptor subunit TctC